MSNLGIRKPVLEPPEWRRKVRDFLYYLADKLQEVASTVPAITPSGSSFTDNAVIRADGTGGDQQDSSVRIDDSGNIDMPSGSGVTWVARDGLNPPTGLEDSTALSLSVAPSNSGAGKQINIAAGEGASASDNGGAVAIRGGIGGGSATGGSVAIDGGSGGTNGSVLIGAKNTAGVTITPNLAVGGTVDGRDVAADGTKLDGIESGATADMTDAEIKTAYENNADTNAFTDADHTKLDGIEAGATADQSAAEIKTAYESNANTNAFTDAEQTKLAGIETAADVTDADNVEEFAKVYIRPGEMVLDDSGATYAKTSDQNFGLGYPALLVFPDIGTNAFARTTFPCPVQWRGKSIAWRYVWMGDQADTSNNFQLRSDVYYYNSGQDPSSSAGTLVQQDTQTALAGSANLSEVSVSAGGTIGASALLITFTMLRQSGSANDTNTGDLWVLGVELWVE
jgi:hypothetical protein